MQGSFFSFWRDSSNVPAFLEVLQELKRVPEDLYRSLEAAAYETRKYRDSNFPGEKLDAGLSATMFRQHALKNLHEAGINAQADHLKWAFEKLPFLGISFYFERKHLRILKGRSGSLPGCGYSLAKHRFYNQQSSSYLENRTALTTTLNLVVLWDFDYLYNLSGLWLACPAWGGRRAEDVSCYWCNPIPYPGETARPPAVPSSGENPPDDLDTLIRPREDGEEEQKRVV